MDKAFNKLKIEWITSKQSLYKPTEKLKSNGKKSKALFTTEAAQV